MLKKFFSRLLEFAFIFFLAAYFIRTAACWLLDAWPVLVVVGAIIAVIIIVYFIYKCKQNSGKW